MNSIPALIYAIVLATGLGLNAATGAETAPDTLVKTTTEEVLAVIKETRDQKQLLRIAETTVLPHFDFARMTQLAVGKGWAKASPEQRQALQKEFRELLVRTYTNALATAEQKEVTLKINPLRADPGSTEVTVKTVVTPAGGKPVPIDYQMAKTPSGWKVFDVTANGISLVTNYRETFNTEISQSGIDGLLKRLTEKNRALVEKHG